MNHAAIEGVRAAIEYLASWGTGTSLRERIVDAMTSICAYEHGLAHAYHDGLRRIRGVTSVDPTSLARARADRVHHARAAHAAAAAVALGEQGICVWDGNFYAARAVEVLGLADRGGLLRTGVSMYSSAAEIGRLLDAIERLG